MEERPDYLPPQPAGPEPELGSAPPPPPPPPPPQQHPPQGGWQQPPAGYPQYGWQQPGWGYAPPPQPDNGPAVAGFVLGLVGGGLLFVSAGLSSLISVGLTIAGIVYSRKGKKKVEAGETTKNAGLAQAGFIIGIVSLVLAVLATLVWILVAVAAITDEDFRDDLERELDDSESISAALRLAGAGARLLIG